MVVQKNISPSKKVLSWAKKNKVKLIVTNKPDEAVKDSDCIMTDKWVSMNDKVNKKSKKKTLKPYQVNKKLMSKAIQMQSLCIVYLLEEGKKLLMR